MLKLNLGSSDDRKPGFLSVDIAPPADVIHDLNIRWPWEDSSVDEIYAHDVFEHLSDCQHVGAQICEGCLGTLSVADSMHPKRRGIASGCAVCRCMPCVCVKRARHGKIWAMNESHRVLKPGGKLDLAVPGVMLSDGRVNPGAFADPTHRTFWTLDDRYYFNEEWNNPQGERGRLGPAYGITALFRGPWRLHEYGVGHERRSKVVAILEAVK